MANSLIIFTVLLIVVLLLLYLHFLRRYSYWRNKGVFFLQPEVPFGALKDLLLGRRSSADHKWLLHKMIKDANHRFGGVYAISTPVLVIVHPEVIKAILIKDSKYFYNRFLNNAKYLPSIYQNLVTYRDNHWKQIRSKVSPVFTPSKMMKVFDNVQLLLEDVHHILEDKAEMKKPLDIKDVMSRLTLDNVALSAFDYESGCLRHPQTDFHKYALITEKFIFKSFFTKIAPFLPEKLLVLAPLSRFGTGRVMWQAKDYFTNLLKERIEHRKLEKTQKNDYLGLYLKLLRNDDEESVRKKDAGLSFEELVATAYSFYAGGYHTTENSLTFGIFELALNQAVQNRLREEICEMLEKHGGKVTYEGVMEMKYLDQVICETLRKYPIISVLMRECNEDYKIDNTDIVIEKGIRLIISVLGLHMDPEYYPNPEKFNPDRFSDEENEKRTPFTYLPFGEGHRMCIGKRFGLIQMKLSIVEIVRAYKITVNEKTKLPIVFDRKNVFIEPANKIYLNVTKINSDIK